MFNKTTLSNVSELINTANEVTEIARVVTYQKCFELMHILRGQRGYAVVAVYDNDTNESTHCIVNESSEIFSQVAIDAYCVDCTDIATMRPVFNAFYDLIKETE